MSLYDNLMSFEKQYVDKDTFEKKLSENRVVALVGKNSTVITGENMGLKFNVSVGLNAGDQFDVECEKILCIKKHGVLPSVMMDLSTTKVLCPLYNVIAQEIGCPVGTIPYYTCFNPSYGIDKTELLETIHEQAEAGVSFMTLHLTADLFLAERAISRKIPIISRGGSLLLRDIKLNKRSENILLVCLDDIVRMCRKYNIVINVGTTYRPSTLFDALDEVNLEELKRQIWICKNLIKDGIHVQMEGIGHIPFTRISEYVSYLRKEIYIPFMPLGPIVSDRTQGYDHITAAIGASYMASIGGADIINAVTREEHTGGIPNMNSILEAIDVASTVISIVNDTRFPQLYSSVKSYNNCMGKPQVVGCSRCGKECPFLWNDSVSEQKTNQ